MTQPLPWEKNAAVPVPPAPEPVPLDVYAAPAAPEPELVPLDIYDAPAPAPKPIKPLLWIGAIVGLALLGYIIYQSAMLLM